MGKRAWDGSRAERPGSAPAQLQSRAGDQRRPPFVQVEGPAWCSPVKAAQTGTRWGAQQGVGQESRDGWDIQKPSLGTPLGRELLPRSRTPSLGSPYTFPPQPHTPGLGRKERPVLISQSLAHAARRLCAPLLPARTLTAVDSLEARVISRFPLSPSRAGTRMKTSVTFWNTSQCYKVKTEPRNFSALRGWWFFNTYGFSGQANLGSNPTSTT